MFKIALTFLSLVLPILAVPMSPNDGLVQRAGSPISGSATVYTPAFSCPNSGSGGNAPVAAVPANVNGNADPCGQQITVQYNGKTAQAKVVDTCTNCGGQNIQISADTYQELTGQQSGPQIDITWNF